MLETIREYAADVLNASGEQDRLEQRHMAYFLDLAEREAPATLGSGQATAFRHLDREWDNLRAGLQWALTQHDPAAGLRLVAALSRFWYVRGYLNEGRSWITQALALAPNAAKETVPEMRGWHVAALRGLGLIALRQGDYSLAEHVTEAALAAQREMDDEDGVARSLNMLAILAREQGQHAKARALWEQSLALRRQAHDDNGTGLVLVNLATVAHEHGPMGRPHAAMRRVCVT